MRGYEHVATFTTTWLPLYFDQSQTLRALREAAVATSASSADVDEICNEDAQLRQSFTNLFAALLPAGTAGQNHTTVSSMHASNSHVDTKRRAPSPELKRPRQPTQLKRGREHANLEADGVSLS